MTDAAPFRAPPLPRLVAAPPPGQVLVIAPHPDDEIVGPGGTLMLHVRQGDPIRVVVVCNGVHGDPDGHFERAGYPALRESESRRAARRFLATEDMHFLGYPDGLDDRGIESTFPGIPGDTPDAKRRSLIDGLASLLRHHLLEIDAKTVYYPWPGEFHADHWACGQAITNLLVNEPETFRERSVLGYEVWTTLAPETVVDISDVHDDKMAAIGVFESQLRYRNYDTLVSGLNAHRGVLLEDPTRRYAEAFIGDYVGLHRGAGGGGHRR